MTATEQIPRQIQVASPRAAASRSRDLLTWLVTVAIVLAMYLLLQNPYWVPGGDSEVYTAIARNLAIGKGYTFNGQPVGIAPPGWPFVLAGAMKNLPGFMQLKHQTMASMHGSLALGYWVCRRFAAPALCGLVILLTAILSHVYPLTFWLHSDALFCLLTTASVLVAMQISEGKTSTWRGILLILLCVAAVAVRWAGLLNWLLVAAVLLSGELRPKLNDRWLRAGWTGLIVLLTFLTIRAALKVPPDVQRKIKEFGGAGEEVQTALVDKLDKNVAQIPVWLNPASGGIGGYVVRAVSWANWFSYLLWQPFRLGRSNALINAVSLLVGWTVLAPLLMLGWHAAKARQWLWPAVMLYSFMLAMNWPHPNARYLVPIAPLIILGAFKSFELIGRRIASPAGATTCNVLLGYFTASMLICNGTLYACDVWVARSTDFYASYEAGLNSDLISAGRWFIAHPPLDGQIGVCERYVNLGKPRISRLALRVTTMLTGKAIVSVPPKYQRAGDPRRNQHFLNWARSLDVKYVLYQPEVSPWRLFHFRVPWLQEAMTGEPAIDAGAGWRLYEIPPLGDEAIRVRVEPTRNWPTHVPGI